MQFHPLAYIVKLNIEMSMANLIVRVSQDTDNIKTRRAVLNGDIDYPLIKRRPKTPTYPENNSVLRGNSNALESTWARKTGPNFVSDPFDDTNDLTRLDSQTWRKYMGMGRYEGRYRHDIRAHTTTEVTVEETEEADIEGSPASVYKGITWPLRALDNTSEEALENSKRTGNPVGMGVHTQIWAPVDREA